jgi:hypothetical protein
MKAHVVNRMVLAIAIAGASFFGLSAVTYARPPTSSQQEDLQEKGSPKHKKAHGQQEQKQEKAQGQRQQEKKQQHQQEQKAQAHEQRQRQQDEQQQKAQQRQQDQQQKKAQQRQQGKQAQPGQQRRDHKRLSEQQQRQRIDTQRQQLSQYRDHLDQHDRLAEQYAANLKQQNRMEHYRFQEQYRKRLREQQRRIRDTRNYDYQADPYFYTPPIYRYSRGGRSYETNQYGADLLREAVNNGYQEGFRAGGADRQDRWRSSYKDSYAYRDANYGYSGYYVARDDYNHYFRQGFRRGYEDGYASRYQYGSYDDGKYSVLQNVLALILNFQPLR